MRPTAATAIIYSSLVIGGGDVFYQIGNVSVLYICIFLVSLTLVSESLVLDCFIAPFM